MIYSATIEYAIRALAHISTLEEGQRILARDLAEVTSVPRQFLGKILHRLARADLLNSAKGRGGGFRLARPANEVNVHNVVAALDGIDVTQRCVVGLADCNDEQPCPMHEEWKHFKKQLMEKVFAMTLAELGENLAAKRLACPDVAEDAVAADDDPDDDPDDEADDTSVD